jgi:ParB/RepB/Spo0J family partition protein
VSRFREVPLAQLREPARPTRADIDEAALDELAASIRTVGVIEPLIVFPAADGAFEIGAGHRRYLAAKRAGLVAVPCIIRTDTKQLLEVRVHENMGRVDLTAVDEAAFYAELYEELGHDTERVAETVKRAREHVERRLILLQGDKDVLAALAAGQIALGVAEEFNRMMRPEDRAYYLDAAVRSGCSIRQARDWRGQANALAESRALLEAQAGWAAPGNGPPAPAPELTRTYAHSAKPFELSSSQEIRPCLFCADELPQWRMYVKFVCAPCADRHLTGVETAGPAPTRH